MKDVLPCEHGSYGLCPQCVRDERDALSARVAELESSLELTKQVSADANRQLNEGRAIMALCLYFGRVRSPDAYKVFADDGDFVYIDDGVPCGYPASNIIPLYAGSAPVPAVCCHPDDVAVDRFADAMKKKMAISRSKGRSGWDDPTQCTIEFLQRSLTEHVGKGDPVDVGNLAMMLFCRGGNTVPSVDESVAKDADRYRWLVDRVLACDYGDNETSKTNNPMCGWRIRHDLLPKNGCRQPAFMFGSSVNAAIDTAIAKHKEGSSNE